LFTIDTLGVYSYVPLLDFIGFDTISYTVCDSVLVPLCVSGTLIIKSSGGGIFAGRDTVSVLKNELYSSSIAVFDNDSTDDGDVIVFNPVSGVSTVQGGQISIQNDGNFTYSPPVDFVGQDSVAYTIRDRCGNSTIGYINIRVFEIIKFPLFIPGGFSPNDDGSHDFFVLNHVEGYGKIRIRAFNRWGSMVYENNDYKDPDWWDGTSNAGLTIGNRLPDGTYFVEVDTEIGERFVTYITLKR